MHNVICVQVHVPSVLGRGLSLLAQLSWNSLLCAGNWEVVQDQRCGVHDQGLWRHCLIIIDDVIVGGTRSSVSRRAAPVPQDIALQRHQDVRWASRVRTDISCIESVNVGVRCTCSIMLWYMYMYNNASILLNTCTCSARHGHCCFGSGIKLSPDVRKKLKLFVDYKVWPSSSQQWPPRYWWRHLHFDPAFTRRHGLTALPTRLLTLFIG